MKKLLILAGLILGTFCAALAQRYCVIDSRYILSRIPDYKKAQKQLDSISVRWQDDIDVAQAQVDDLSKSYQAEEVMLTDTLKEKRMEQINAQQKAVRMLEQKRFGYKGDLFRVRETLVKPIQDKIYNAVQQLAAQHLYDFVLDKAGGISVFYADPKLDKSDDVLKILGIEK